MRGQQEVDDISRADANTAAQFSRHSERALVIGMEYVRGRSHERFEGHQVVPIPSAFFDELSIEQILPMHFKGAGYRCVEIGLDSIHRADRNRNGAVVVALQVEKYSLTLRDASASQLSDRYIGHIASYVH